jgi:hypothetical protein
MISAGGASTCRAIFDQRRKRPADGFDWGWGLRCGWAMHFSIEGARLVALADAVRLLSTGGRQRTGKVMVWACAARVFLRVNTTIAGEEALVLRDGGCVIRLADLLDLLTLFARRPNLTMSADTGGARIETAEVRCWDYTDQVQPPGEFTVGPVVDLPVVGVIGGSHPPKR